MPLTVTKRGRYYYARGTVAGQRIRESTRCNRKADAEAWARRLEADLLERHSLGPARTLTFAEAALDYIEAGGEARFLRPILEFFGPRFRIADLDNAALNRAAAAIYPAAAPATINRQLVTPIRAIVTLAAEDGKTHLRKFRSRAAGRARTRWLRPAEAEALIAAASPHLRLIVLGLLGTGARVSELLSARAEHWRPATGQIWIENTKNDFPRMLAMPARVRDALLASDPPEAGTLFRRPDGGAYTLKFGATPIKTAFSRARGAAGLGPDVTPHVLRHTWATWFHAQTRDFGGLLDLGGWRSADMAQRYRKIAPDDLADDLARAGWNFTTLGRDLPPPATRKPGLRLVSTS